MPVVWLYQPVLPSRLTGRKTRQLHRPTWSVFVICLGFVFFPDIDAPTNLVTTEVTEDTATVSWDQVQAEIEGYMLSYTSAEGSSAEIPLGRDRTAYRLIGLRPGVLHTIYIWAYKGDKVSRKSSTKAETGKIKMWPENLWLKGLLFDILQRLHIREKVLTLMFEHSSRCALLSSIHV